MKNDIPFVNPGIREGNLENCRYHWVTSAFRRIFLLLLILTAAKVLHADSLEGTVTRVIDGDTVEVKDAKGNTLRFRLLGADAPEKGQDGHARATDSLRQRVQGRKVTVDWVRAQVCPSARGKCSQLAKIMYRGEDIGLRQIRLGNAWQDDRQLREQSTTDKTLYSEAELTAKQRRVGVWKAKNPTPPWAFRSKR